MSTQPIDIKEIRGKVGVGILTTRKDECDAVAVRLKPALPVIGGRNSYAYTRLSTPRGEIGVVVTRCPEPGESVAQAVTRNMIDDLNPTWILLVGIAGGVPADEYSLGDVILASRLHDFSVTAALQDKPRENQIAGGPMHRDVERILTMPELETLLREWNAEDSVKLTKPPVVAPEDISDSCYYGQDAWRRKVSDSLRKHFPSGMTARQPKLWVGCIASSDTLMKDADLLAQWLASARQVTHVEMELAGVYQAARHGGKENYPVLAIRGLSDIVGYKRDDAWTKYACHSAAAFTDALVRSGLLQDSNSQIRIENGHDEPEEEPAPNESLDPGVDAKFAQYLADLRALGPETSENEDRYIRKREGFLAKDDAALDELIESAVAQHATTRDFEALSMEYEVGRILIEKRRAEEATRILYPLQHEIEKLIDSSPAQDTELIARMLDSIGEAARFAGDYSRAKKLYEEAGDISPNNYFVLKHLGTICRIEGDYQQAESYFKEAAEIDNTYHVEFSLGYLKSEMRNHTEAKEHYQRCTQLLKQHKINDYYRVFLKQAYLFLLDNCQKEAEKALKTTLSALEQCLEDNGYTGISGFAAHLLLSLLVVDSTEKHDHLAFCEDYISNEIDRMPHAVFYCVYSDLDRILQAEPTALLSLTQDLSREDPLLRERFNALIHKLQLKHAQFIRQKSNTILTEFPVQEKEIVVYVRTLPERLDAIMPIIRKFHRVQRVKNDSQYYFKLSFEIIADEATTAIESVGVHLRALLDHSSLVVLLKSQTKRFEFQHSFWRPFTALISSSIGEFAFRDHCSMKEPHGGNDLVRVFSQKLITADPQKRGKRVFVNPMIGCSQDCKFCYLPQYGVKTSYSLDHIHNTHVDVSAFKNAIARDSLGFRTGNTGTLLSIGSFTDPFLLPSPTLCLLKEFKADLNPIQIATRVYPENECFVSEIEDIFHDVKDQLMINISCSENTSDSSNYLKQWLDHADKINLTVYAKPFFDETQKCFDWFVDLGKRYPTISFVVGSLYYGDKTHLPKGRLSNHRHDHRLRSPVVSKPATPGMKHTNEEAFREMLQTALKRTVYRTSSCPLATKYSIPDPLGNFGGPFCVPGCPNENCCRNAE